MNDAELVAFLEWALPRLGLRWTGFKNFRNTIRKRIHRRLDELELPTLAAYRAALEADPSEGPALDRMCRVTISRLYRDIGVMAKIRDDILPVAIERARMSERPVRVWSAGCASGEEPYTIALIWQLTMAETHPDVTIEILASDVDAVLVERARRGVYEAGSLRELPAAIRDAGFEQRDDTFVVKDFARRIVAFDVGDVRSQMPDGPFDLILCRNLAFTYFAEHVQRDVGARLVERLARDGVLVIGAKEVLPEGLPLVEIGGGMHVART